MLVYSSLLMHYTNFRDIDILKIYISFSFALIKWIMISFERFLLVININFVIQNNAQNGNHEVQIVQNPPVMQIHFNQRPAGHQIPGQANQNADMIPNMMNLFNMMIMQYNINNQRHEAEFDAFQTILLNWKRKYQPADIESNPNCCVCLDNFNIDEEVVELHCNPGSFGHIFHWDWISDWSQKQRTCPLCRKDFVELVKQEKEKGLIKNNNPEENKQSQDLRAEGSYRNANRDVIQEIRNFNQILIGNNRQYRANEIDDEEDDNSRDSSLIDNQNQARNIAQPINEAARARISKLLLPLQQYPTSLNYSFTSDSKGKQLSCAKQLRPW